MGLGFWLCGTEAGAFDSSKLSPRHLYLLHTEAQAQAQAQGQGQALSQALASASAEAAACVPTYPK